MAFHRERVDPPLLDDPQRLGGDARLGNAMEELGRIDAGGEKPVEGMDPPDVADVPRGGESHQSTPAVGGRGLREPIDLPPPSHRRVR